MSPRFAGALIAPLMFIACATMTRGVRQSLAVESTPPGAAVTTSVGQSCPATPCKLERLSRKAKFTLTLKLPGYRDETVSIAHKLSPIGAGQAAVSFAIPGGILWSLIDVLSGATQDLRPDPVSARLQPASAPAANAAAPKS